MSFISSISTFVATRKAWELLLCPCSSPVGYMHFTRIRRGSSSLLINSSLTGGSTVSIRLSLIADLLGFTRLILALTTVAIWRKLPLP